MYKIPIFWQIPQDLLEVCASLNIYFCCSQLILSLTLQTKQRFLHRESFSLACFWVIQPFFMAIVTTFQPVFRPNCLSFFTFYWKNVEITENYQILGVSQKFCKVVGIKGGFISKRIIIHIFKLRFLYLPSSPLLAKVWIQSWAGLNYI